MKFTFNKIFGIFAVLLALTFIVLAFFVVFADSFDYIPQNYRMIFGALLFMYGVFRLVSVYFKVNTGNQILDNEND